MKANQAPVKISQNKLPVTFQSWMVQRTKYLSWKQKRDPYRTCRGRRWLSILMRLLTYKILDLHQTQLLKMRGQNHSIKINSSFQRCISVWVEAHVGFQAKKLGIHMGFHTLDILGDSRTIITKCQSADRDRSNIGAIIGDIQSLKTHFQEIRSHFIPRTKNTCAHLLAKAALKNGKEQYLEGGIPQSIRREIEKNFRELSN